MAEKTDRFKNCSDSRFLLAEMRVPRMSARGLLPIILFKRRNRQGYRNAPGDIGWWQYSNGLGEDGDRLVPELGGHKRRHDAHDVLHEKSQVAPVAQMRDLMTDHP